MSLATGSNTKGLSGAPESGGADITPVPVVVAPGATVTASSALLTLALSAGATLVSWSVQRSPKGMNTWTTIATGLTDLEYEATGLDSSSDYDFQGIDILATTSTESNVVAVTTAEFTGYEAYRILSAGLADSVNALGQKAWYLRILNNTGRPIETVRIGGKNMFAGHAPILGAWAVTGNVSGASGDVYERMLAGGANTLTPADGSLESPTLWAFDRLTLANPVPNGSELVIRLQTDGGDVSSCIDFTAASRPNFGDISAMGFAIDDGDFGSDLAHVQTNPSGWYGGVNGLLSMIELGYTSETEQTRIMVIGDSVATGYIQGVPARDTWQYAFENAVDGAYTIGNYGCPGYRTEQYASVFDAWLASPHSDIYHGAIFVPASWNNMDDGSLAISESQGAISAAAVAGMPITLLMEVPASAPAYPYGNEAAWDAILAWARTQTDAPFIETWQAVATGGVGPTIAATYTGDGVHNNEAGQVVQGTTLGAEAPSIAS